MKTKKIIERIIIKLFYLISKLASKKIFWFLSNIFCYLFVFRYSIIKSLDLNILFEIVVLYIIFFEIICFFYLDKQLNDLKKLSDELKNNFKRL